MYFFDKIILKELNTIAYYSSKDNKKKKAADNVYYDNIDA